MKKLILFLILIASLEATAQRRNLSRTNVNPVPTFSAKIFTNAGFTDRGYLEYLPKDYYTNPTRKYPLVIFLHGAGEQGDGSAAGLQALFNNPNTPPWYLQQGNHFTFPYFGKSGEDSFIVLMPQQNAGGWFLTFEQEFVTFLLPKYAGRYKTDQVFITGLSLGGEGCYNIGDASVGDAFCAMAPMAGYNNGSGCNISSRKIAIWAFHGDADGTIAYSTGLGAFQATSLCTTPSPVAELKFTTIAGGGHSSSWLRGYRIDNVQDNPNLWQWFLSKNKL